VLAAFMEDRNILWGELVGGLLIVGCSVALVISLWQSLEGVPYFPFLLFSAITAALFAAGEYTLHHWKLEATSRGLLVIALLLTPLNLLVLADPSAVGRSGVEPGGLTDLAVKLVSLLAFVGLTRTAGRDVLSAEATAAGLLGRGWLLPVGIVGTSAVPLLGSRILEHGNPLYLLVLGVLSQAAQATVLYRLPKTDTRGARSVFTLLGLCCFAAAVALGFLVLRYPEKGEALHYLGVILPFSGWFVLRAGTRMQRGIEEEGKSTSGGWHTVATAVVLTGVAVMLIGEALAWPSAAALLAASAINGVLLTVLAFSDCTPWVHAAAIPCLALAAVLGYHEVASNVPADARALLLLLASPASAAVLAAYTAALTVLGEWLIRGIRRADGVAYAIGGAGTGVVALILASSGGITSPETAAVVYATCSACALASNYRWRRQALTYAGLGLAVGASLWTLQWVCPGDWRVWQLVLAVESSLQAVGYLGSDRGRSGFAWRDVGVIAGILVVALALSQGVDPAWFAATTAALALTSLLLALADRSREWFASCQVAASASVLYAAHVWLGSRALHPGSFDPQALQTYGIALALLSLVWAVARLAFRTSPASGDIGLHGNTVDRVVLAGVVVGQLVLALVGVGPGVVAELTPGRGASSAVVAEAYGAGAQILLGLLALVLTVGLADRARTKSVLGLMLLAFTVPVLISGPFSAELATASALRWGLAACCVCLSMAVVLRERLGELAGAVGIRFDRDPNAAAAARAIIDLAAAFVILLTVWLAVNVFTGTAPAGPLADTFFARIGLVASAVTPLVLLVLGMSAVATGERSPVYALVAGMIANAAFTGGFALELVTAGGTIGESEGVHLLQLATLGAAVWGIVWIGARRWLYAGGIPAPGTARPLLALQIALAVGGSIVLLGGAVAIRGNLLVERLPWSVEAGSRLGAVSLLASLAAFAVWHLQRREPLPWQAPFFLGLTLPVLLACTAERAREGTGFAVLLLAWPGYLLLWSLAAFRPDLRKRYLPGVTFDDVELPVAVGLASIFTVLVAVKAVSLRDAYLPAAAASVLTALAFTALAVARRSGALAFVAAVLGNVAVSLAVAQRNHDTDFSQWYLTLARANVAASSVAALAWLAARRLLRDIPRPGILLAVQAMLGLAVNTLVLLVPLCVLFLEPGKALPEELLPDYPGAGWPALLLAATAAFWYCHQVAPGRRIDVLGVFGLSAGVLFACLAAPLDAGNWLSYHVLSAAWAVLGLGAVVLGSLAYALRRSGLTDDERRPQARWFSELITAEGIRQWVEIVGTALALLALRGGWADPYRPYPSAAALLLVSVMAAALAMWFRRARHVWASGLLLNLAFAVMWLHPGSTLDAFLLTNAIGLATAAAFWTLVSLALPGDGLPLDRGSPLPFAHFAAIAAWGLVLAVSVIAVTSDLASLPLGPDSVLTWPAVFAVGVALSAALWDRSARWPVAALYGLGLAATALALHAAKMRPDVLARTGVLALAGYVLVAGLVRWSAASQIVTMLRLPARGGGWFVPVQLAGAVTVAGVGAWFCVSFPSLAERLTGAAAVALVVPAAVLLGAVGRRWSLALVTVALAQAACSLPDPAGPAPWLSRTALLLTAFAVTNMAFSDGLPYWLKRSAAWRSEGRYCGAVVGCLAVGTLLALLALEFQHFKKEAGRTPLDLSLVGLVVLSIAWMMTSAVRAAVQPGRELLGLTERGRGLYVYAVEALLVLLFLHVRLNVPQLFTGWAGKFWPLIVMTIAFAGVGLGEFFERRGLTVLAGPLRRTGLFLPLLPLVAFWAHPPQMLLNFSEERLPGAVPVMNYLHHQILRFDRYAVLWLMAGLLYAWQSVTRRSFGFGLVAALAANMGVWALLIHGEIPFLAHPQLWMIPLAAIVLVSEHVNRDRLSAETAAGLRYLGVCIVYVSSTADLFIAGLDSVLLPIVLAAFAVAGVLAGIVLRVRAFMFMGVSFLFLDILSMIWHVAVDHYQPWLWWVSGIALGVAILALFAVFEKRRNDVLRLIEEIKRWN
jgi:hypothetical protein